MATASMATGQEDGVDSSIKADLALKLVLVHLLLAKATSGPVFPALEVEAALGRGLGCLQQLQVMEVRLLRGVREWAMDWIIRPA